MPIGSSAPFAWASASVSWPDSAAWRAALIALCLELVAAVVLDVRERRFPNGLFVAVGLTCLALHVLERGAVSAVGALASSLLVAGPVLAFELAWRRTHGGSVGIGLGDIKFLAATCLWRPFPALAAFALGLMSLAAFGVVRSRPSLPLIPFAAPALALVVALGAG